MTGTVVLHVQGETLLLHPERAVIWPERETVIVADTHFGKSGVFGRHGLAVPAGSDQADRDRLIDLVAATKARRLLILGDFLHAPLAFDSQEAKDLEKWSAALQPVTIQVIAGNHDRGVTTGWRGSLEWIEGAKVEAPFRFVHEAAKTPPSTNGLFSVSGHIHPVIGLGGMRKKAARVPVFWQQANGLVLPSFGLFTGGGLVAPVRGDRIYAVSSERVVPFPIHRTRPSI